MSVAHWIQSIVEIGLISVTLWGLFNEERIAEWERKLFKRIKRRLLK